MSVGTHCNECPSAVPPNTIAPQAPGAFDLAIIVTYSPLVASHPSPSFSAPSLRASRVETKGATIDWGSQHVNIISPRGRRDAAPVSWLQQITSPNQRLAAYYRATFMCRVLLSQQVPSFLSDVWQKNCRLVSSFNMAGGLPQISETIPLYLVHREKGFITVIDILLLLWFNVISICHPNITTTTLIITIFQVIFNHLCKYWYLNEWQFSS